MSTDARPPGWFLVYNPDADGMPGVYETYYGRGGGEYFVAEAGIVVKGDSRARELVARLTAELAESVGPDNSPYEIEPLDFDALAGDSGEHAEIRDFITDAEAR